MGWYATYKALINGTGPYGTVKQSLKGEVDPARTLAVALREIQDDETLCLDKSAKARIAYWRQRAQKLDRNGDLQEILKQARYDIPDGQTVAKTLLIKS